MRAPHRRPCTGPCWISPRRASWKSGRHHRRAGCGAPSACDWPPGSASCWLWPSASRGASSGHVPAAVTRPFSSSTDAVGRRHQRRAVGHRDDGGAPAQRPECRGDFAFGGGVELAGGLVEHQEHGPAEQRCRQHDPAGARPPPARASRSATTVSSWTRRWTPSGSRRACGSTTGPSTTSRETSSRRISRSRRSARRPSPDS